MEVLPAAAPSNVDLSPHTSSTLPQSPAPELIAPANASSKQDSVLPISSSTSPCPSPSPDVIFQRDESSTRSVVYLGRLRVRLPPSSGACLEALENIIVNAKHAPSIVEMQLCVSTTWSSILYSGKDGEMCHPLRHVVCFTQRGVYICYIMALSTVSKRIFQAHAIQVSAALLSLSLSLFTELSFPLSPSPSPFV